MERYDWTNCPKVIKAEMNTLQTEFSRLSGLHLSGIYLHGSLALGGFQPARSDIDMIVVTSEQIGAASERVAIELLLRVSKFPSPVDVYFLLEHDITPFQQPLPFMLHYSEQRREDYEQMLRSNAWKQENEQRQYDSSLAIYLTVLHRKGICLVGKPIEEIFPHVSEQIFRDALVANFQELQKRRLQDIVSFVLNACRSYAYLCDGALLAKDEGADWGLAYLPEIYHPLIQQALALYRSEKLRRSVGRSLLDGFTTYMEEAILRQQAAQA